jgi:hypothetical protein
VCSSRTVTPSPWHPTTISPNVPRTFGTMVTLT